jgi:hypothetical protein
VAEWRRVMAVEVATPKWGHIIRLMLSPWRWPRPGVRRFRYRACLRCPVFDRNLRRCRPYNGSAIGCGCYVPYAIAAGQKCWLRKAGIELEGHGYD